MNVVGIALSQVEPGASGVAVVGGNGDLVHLTSAGSDDELVDLVAPYVQGPCLVAVGAPAPSAAPRTGQGLLDEAELLPGQRFRWIARRLGLDTNPRSGRERRAVEVDVAAAATGVLGLPGLERGPGDPAQPGALRSLVDPVEALAVADPPLRVASDVPGAEAWRALARSARSDHSNDVHRERDQVDAVLGAYLGLLSVHSPSGSARHDPSQAVRRYAELRPALQQATARYVRLVTSILDEAGINYLTVTGRTKSPASFATKASLTIDGEPIYPAPLRDITDQIGVRVITYVHSDVQAVVDLLVDQVAVHEDRDLGEETASQGRFGYASRHLLIEVPGEPGTGHHPAARAQVQIRTVLQHAWAEFEHDIRYKGSIPEEHAPDFDRRFTLAAGLLELADREFSAIRDRLRLDVPVAVVDQEDDDPRLSSRDLAAFLAGQFLDAGWSRTDHYAWIAGIVLELGITSLTDLAQTLRLVDTDELTTHMGYRYPPGAVRRLDDALLWVHGEDYLALSANRDRVEALSARLARMRHASQGS